MAKKCWSQLVLGGNIQTSINGETEIITQITVWQKLAESRWFCHSGVFLLILFKPDNEPYLRAGYWIFTKYTATLGRANMNHLLQWTIKQWIMVLTSLWLLANLRQHVRKITLLSKGWILYILTFHHYFYKEFSTS